MQKEPFATLTTDGDYEFSTRIGREHLLTLKGTFDGATVTMTAYNFATSTYTAVDNGAWTASDEITFSAQSDYIRLTITNDGAATSIGVSLVPLNTRR